MRTSKCILSPAHIALLGFVLWMTASTARAEEALTVTAITQSKAVAESTRQAMQQLCQQLDESLEQPVRFQAYDSAAAARQAYRQGEVQLLWANPRQGLWARVQQPGTVIAAGEYSQAHRTNLIAHVETGLIESRDFPEAISGHPILFGPEDSFSQRLVPEWHIRQHFADFSPRRLFPHMSYEAEPERMIQQVVSGDYDIGTLAHEDWLSLVETHPEWQETLRVIWQTPNYAGRHWILREGVEMDLEALQRGLIGIKSETILEPLAVSGFQSVENDPFKPYLELAQRIEWFEE